jgi:hypothetical protein
MKTVVLQANFQDKVLKNILLVQKHIFLLHSVTSKYFDAQRCQSKLSQV